MHGFGRAMVYALARSRERPRERSEKHDRELHDLLPGVSSHHHDDRP